MPFIDVAQIAVSFLFLLLVASMGFAGNSKTRFLLVLLLTLSVVFSSDFVASSIALGLHYYRFHAYVFLLLVASLATLPVVLGDVKSQSLRKGTFVVFLVSYLTIAVGPLILPHYERGKIQKSYKNQGLSAENRVLGYLESSPRRGRIFIEYNTDSNRFPFLSVHYLASEASRRTGFESLNGLFIQSSLAYRMPVASANLLGAKTFHIPLLFTDNAQLDDETKLLQLLDFGVTHIIAGSTAFSQRVADASNVSPIKIGPYFVFDLSEFAKATVTKVAKPIIGYVDLSETLPFKFVEFYFYSQRDLYLNYQLVDMSNYHQSRPDLSLWLVNSPEDAEFGEFKKSHLDMAKAPVLRSFFKESSAASDISCLSKT